MKKIIKLSVLLSNIFQCYIIFTIARIIEEGFNETNTIMLLFNIAYIISFQVYNNKINLIFEQRGKYLSLKYENADLKTINERNREICKSLFEDTFDGDFRS